MDAQTIEKKLTNHTLEICGFDEKRNYVSLSNIISEPEELVRQFKEGYTADEKARLKCYKGYCMEMDLRLRIMECFSDLPILVNQEFGTPDKLFLCHPDLMIGIIPADIKSVLKDEWIPQVDWHISKKIKWQMNAQMLMAGVNNCYVIYESRESGIIKVFELKANASIQVDIKAKMELIRGLLNTNN